MRWMGTLALLAVVAAADTDPAAQARKLAGEADRGGAGRGRATKQGVVSVKK